MEKQDVIAALAALAQETRLDVFRLLVRAGGDGLSAGALADAVGVLRQEAERLASGDLRSGRIWESEDELFARARKLHPEQADSMGLDASTSHFRANPD